MSDFLTLGAVANDKDIAMAYDAKNGTWLAIQHHPEIKYGLYEDESSLRQENHINHFMELAIMHHYALQDQTKISPDIISKILQNRLQQCHDDSSDIGYIDSQGKPLLYCDDLSQEEIDTYTYWELECA